LLKIPIGQLSIDGGIAVKINKPHTARAAGRPLAVTQQHI